MSKHGPCTIRHTPPVPAMAWWLGPNGHYANLCQACLDIWFDNADDDETLEPLQWGWYARPAGPSPEAVSAWARNPANHQDVAAVLRMEARINPDWLSNFLTRMHRANGRGLADR